LATFLPTVNFRLVVTYLQFSNQIRFSAAVDYPIIIIIIIIIIIVT